MDMELAISTDYDKEFQEVENIEESLKRIAQAGFTHIHWCYDWDGDYIYSEAEMEQIRDWMEKYHLKCKGLHASKGSGRYVNEVIYHYRKDYTSSISYNRCAGVDQVKNRVDLAQKIGCKEIVLHMYLPFLDFEKDPALKEQFYQNTFLSLDELEPYCLERNVKICIENLFEAPAALQVEQFDLLTKRYSPDFLGLCLDTGHANLVWGDRFVTELMERFKDRIFAVHIHDNFGWGEGRGYGDAHQIPGTCGINWSAFMNMLKTSAYQLPLVLELAKSESEPDELFLKRALDSGKWLLSL